MFLVSDYTIRQLLLADPTECCTCEACVDNVREFTGHEVTDMKELKRYFCGLGALDSELFDKITESNE